VHQLPDDAALFRPTKTTTSVKPDIKKYFYVIALPET